MKHTILAVIITMAAACTQQVDDVETDTSADYSYIEDTDDAVAMCEADVDELVEENAQKDATIAALQAEINKMLVDSHDYRQALIECGCSMEGQ